MPEIADVTIWSNGIVMTFDQDGNQLDEYQGRFVELRGRIAADAPEHAKFYIGSWPDRIEITRSQFESESWNT